MDYERNIGIFRTSLLAYSLNVDTMLGHWIDSIHGRWWTNLNKGWMPDVIWVLDCSAISTHWSGGKKAYIPKTDKAILGIKILQKTMDIINELKPKYWFVENPVGVMRKMGLLQPFHRKTVTYCQYGDVRMKPTDIWTNCLHWTPRERCKNGDPCHVRAPRGSKNWNSRIKGKNKTFYNTRRIMFRNI